MRAIGCFVMYVALCTAGFAKYEFDPNMCDESLPFALFDCRRVQRPGYADPDDAGQGRRSAFGTQSAASACCAHTRCSSWWWVWQWAKLADYWVIGIDDANTDSSAEVVRRHLGHIPGRLVTVYTTRALCQGCSL